MKRTITTIYMMLTFISVTVAQEASDTTIINGADSVKVVSDSKSMSVEVIGKKGDPDYHFTKTLELDDSGVSVSKESNTDFDFKIPFSKSSESNRRTVVSLKPTISIGFVSTLGGPSNLDTNFGKSVEITWNAWEARVYWGDKNWSVSTGLWFNWKNYRMTGRTRFDKSDNEVILTSYPENAEIKFSRVHTLSYQIPLLFHYNTDAFKFASGVLFNLNGHGNLKTRYSLDGESYKDRDKGIHINNFTMDFIGIASFKNWIGVYVKYSPFNVLDTNLGPKFHSLSTGLIFNF